MHETTVKITAMAGGNPGCIVALTHLVTTDPTDALLDKIMVSQMSGPHVWVMYKDICQQDDTVFAEFIRRMTPERLIELGGQEDRGQIPAMFDAEYQDAVGNSA